jgi:hypothetical protein
LTFNEQETVRRLNDESVEDSDINFAGVINVLSAEVLSLQGKELRGLN